MSWYGVDVGKRELAVCVHGGESRMFAQPQELAEAVAFITEQPDARVVLEATGGYEKPLVSALRKRAIPVTVVNPAHAHAFRRSLGKLSKTDEGDAQVLARMGAALEPEATPAVSAERERLQALVSRRAQLVAMSCDEVNHAEHSHVREVDGSIGRVRKVLAAEIRKLDGLIASLLSKVPELGRAAAVLQSVPGVGPTVAAGMLVHLPELGRADKGEIAALAGLAPYNRDSGSMKGTRSIRAGRGAVRSLLYMAALVASRHNPRFRELYAQLLARGKPKKVALIAIARKLLVVLNAMVKTGQPWSWPPTPEPA